MLCKRNKYICLAMLVLMISSAAVPVVASSIGDAKSEKSSLEKRKAETETRIAALETEKDNIMTYIEKLDKELANLGDRIDELTEKEKNGKKELALTKKKLAEAETDVVDQYETMKNRIQYMYENGGTEYIEIIFDAGSISDLLNRAEYISKISEYDDMMLERYQQAKLDVEDKKTAIEVKIKEIKEVQEEVNHQKQTVQKLADKKTTELKNYKKKIASSEDLVHSYESQIQQKEKEIEDLLEAERKRVEAEEKRQAEERRQALLKKQAEERRKAAVGSTQSATTKKSNSESSGSTNSSATTNNQVSAGGFRWPLPGHGRISSYYGGRTSPTAGASSNHKGIDIPAPTGTSIIAAKSGTVVTASYSSSAGNYVMISHGGGVFTVYMHCSKLLVSVGQSVSQGQTIALVGSTGYSTGPHLHFGISVNGGYQNPLSYVSP